MWNSASKLLKLDAHSALYTIVRHKDIRLPEVSKSLEQKLLEMNPVDPKLHFKVDIGLPPTPNLSIKELKERRDFIKKIKMDPELEKKSRLLLLNPDLDDIRSEWAKSTAPAHIQMIANHYKIYDHLFGDAFFTPYVVMNIYYPQKDNKFVAPVCRGNVVKPTEAFHQPEVEFKSNSDDLWSLTMVNPDGNLLEEEMECIHWFVGNIPGGDIKKGEIIWDYLPPFPPRGIGFQRLVFILYKQEKKIDYSKLKKQIPCLELKDRNFKTFEFYKERQEDLTPAGLAFFQSDWDKSSRKIFHEVLNMEEPVFEYDHEPQPLREQAWFPKKKPFNLYMDKYRDPRDINQEYLLKKLKDINPLERPPEPFPYPKAIRSSFRNLPSWLKIKEIRYKAGLGRINKLSQDEYE